MEQWVFVLPGADDQSECTFFANPSIAGYHVDDGTDIQLSEMRKETMYMMSC